MALILNGTDNSATTPSVQGSTGGTSTGVYYPATNQIALATNGTNALTINSAQAAAFAGAVSVSGILTALTAASGTNTTQVATTAFAYGTFSASGNGYQKFPSGLIVQWGSTVGTSTTTVTLPITFPNATLGTALVTNGDYAANSERCGLQTSSTSQIVLAANTASAYRWSWLVFGY